MTGSPPATAFKSPTCYLGLLRRRGLWVPTWRAWLILATGIGLAVYCVSRSLHGYLAVTQPVNASVLVVEGWLPDYALAEALREFERGNYDLLLTTGGPIDQGSLLAPYETYAAAAAESLRRMGANPRQLQAIPAATVRRNRTYASAAALHEWLTAHHPELRRLNVVSDGVHARRTRWLFHQALGESFRVGILAIQDRDYDPSHWWRYSEGLKNVLTEALGYLHARLLFNPRLEEPPATTQPSMVPQK